MNNVLFRIFLGHEIRIDRRAYPVEQVDVQRASEYVANVFPAGFTVLTASGRWKGTDGRLVSEGSTVFEIIGAADDAERVRNLALDLKGTFRQDSVLVTSQALASVDFV